MRVRHQRLRKPVVCMSESMATHMSYGSRTSAVFCTRTAPYGEQRANREPDIVSHSVGCPHVSKAACKALDTTAMGRQRTNVAAPGRHESEWQVERLLLGRARDRPSSNDCPSCRRHQSTFMASTLSKSRRILTPLATTPAVEISFGLTCSTRACSEVPSTDRGA